MKIRLIAVATLVLVTLTGVVFLYSGHGDIKKGTHSQMPPIAPMQRNIGLEEALTREKKEGTPFDLRSKGLFVRSEPSQADVFFVKFSDTSETYRYDGKSKRISAASETEWNSAINEIACRDREHDTIYEVIADRANFTFYFTFPRSEIPTFGPFALQSMPSREKDRVVVLSADGPVVKASPGLWAFSGSGGGIDGQRYVQILDLQKKEYVTQPIALTSIQNFPEYGFCWTDDPRFIFAYEFAKAGTESEMDFHVIETDR